MKKLTIVILTFSILAIFIHSKHSNTYHFDKTINNVKVHKVVISRFYLDSSTKFEIKATFPSCDNNNHIVGHLRATYRSIDGELVSNMRFFTFDKKNIKNKQTTEKFTQIINAPMNLKGELQIDAEATCELLP